MAAAVGALRAFDKPEIEDILKSMSTHQNPAILAQVARSYGVHGYDSGIAIILGYASRPELAVRTETTRAMVNLVGKGKMIKPSFDFFTRRLNDESADVRGLALNGFGFSDDPRRGSHHLIGPR